MGLKCLSTVGFAPSLFAQPGWAKQRAVNLGRQAASTREQSDNQIRFAESAVSYLWSQTFKILMALSSLQITFGFHKFVGISVVELLFVQPPTSFF